MPPSLEAMLAREKTPLFKQSLGQRQLVLGDGVISRSPERALSNNAKGKRAIKPRSYGEGPLPFKPSDVAPRNARIVGRVAEPGKQPIYTLQVGHIEVDGVSLHEILEYVSPYELERYEHQQFEEERQAMDAALAYAAEEEERRKERHKERAKRKGIIHFEEVGDDDDGGDRNASAEGTARARPTYKHLFKKAQERRRRRKRDPVTNELLPLSDEEQPGSDDIEIESSEDGRSRSTGHAPGSAFGDLQKRRRRKRDPVTNELLPLPPLAPSLLQKTQETHARSSPVTVRRSEVSFTAGEPRKRQRRRRHPITGELMPLGWKYDPDAERGSYETRREGMSPSMGALSISHEQQPKRVKLASESSADDTSQQRRPLSSSSRISQQEAPKLHSQPAVLALEVSETDDLAQDDKRHQAASPGNLKSAALDDKDHQATSMGSLRSPLKTSMLRPNVQKTSSESSTEPVTLASFLESSAAQQDVSDSEDSLSYLQRPAIRNTPTQGKTSITDPVAAKQPDREEETDDIELEEDEWFVESIVGHKISDPTTRPRKPSGLLYHTKWEGHDVLTWEPAESFSDANTVAEYRRRVGLDGGKQAIKSPARVVPVVASNSMSRSVPRAHESTRTIPAQSLVANATHKKEGWEDDEDESEDEGYEIEKILAHHMSDPRTHPGKPQTMLYRVKWVGFPETDATWEPKSSFPSMEIINAYRRKAGLKPEAQ